MNRLLLEKKGRKRGEGGKKGKERKEKRKKPVWQPFASTFRPSMQSENTDQSADLFTPQLARKILPQFVQDGIMCE